MADHVLEHLPDVRRADEDRLRAAERLASPAGELLVAAHRVLELGAVRLDRVASAGCGPDRSAEEDVVAEDEVGRQLLAHRRGIALDPVVELGAGAVLHELDLVALVAVEHEDRQQAADVRAQTPVAPPRSKRSGCDSWLSTVTSWPARVHSRASARV